MVLVLWLAYLLPSLLCGGRNHRIVKAPSPVSTTTQIPILRLLVSEIWSKESQVNYNYIHALDTFP